MTHNPASEYEALLVTPGDLERAAARSVESVGILKLDGEGVWMGFLLPRDNAIMLEEAAALIEGSYIPGQVDEGEGAALVTIEFRRKPAGFVDALPEFEGW